ncbi:MAG: DUF4111 domain-containing protein [Clostridia bacterium]|nr:DUF4111 domain-containing protein [Clostridia bacterium]
MICLKMNLGHLTPFNRDQVMRLMQTTCRYDCHIMFLHNNRTINGKSMLGLLSLGETGEEMVEIQFEGADEEQALRDIRLLLEGGVQPEKDRQDAVFLLGVLKERLATLMKENLLGIYVHGSLAFGCFHWNTSDIDFLVVVKQPMTLEEKIAFVRTMEELSDEAPPKGFECSVMLESVCREMPYPAPFEVHFSNMWREEIRQDAEGYCMRVQGTDPDLTTHVLSLRHSNLQVLGPQAMRVFGPVKKENCLNAMYLDTDHVQEKLMKNAIYIILTLCRAVAYKQENLVLSKVEGGEWAIRNMPSRFQAVIQAAVNAYREGREMYFDMEDAKEFCNVAISEMLG